MWEDKVDMFQFVDSQKSWSQWLDSTPVLGVLQEALSGRIMAFPFVQLLRCPAASIDSSGKAKWMDKVENQVSFSSHLVESQNTDLSK